MQRYSIGCIKNESIYPLQDDGVKRCRLCCHLILDLLLDSRFCSSIGWPMSGAVSSIMHQLCAVVTPEAIGVAVVIFSDLTGVIMC